MRSVFAKCDFHIFISWTKIIMWRDTKGMANGEAKIHHSALGSKGNIIQMKSTEMLSGNRKKIHLTIVSQQFFAVNTRINEMTHI